MNKVGKCPSCGEINTIIVGSDSASARCIKCLAKTGKPKGFDLPPLSSLRDSYASPLPSQRIKVGSGKRFGGMKLLNLLWLLVVGGFAWMIVAQDSSNSTSKESNTTYSESKPIPSYPEVAIPVTGLTHDYTSEERVAPLELKTSSGANYLVKLVSAYSQKPAMTMFIRGGNTVSIKVPLGTYEVKYASGKKWYGEGHLFGPETGYNKADKLLTFKNTGYQITGFTITLYNVLNGNMRTTEIDPSEF